MTEAIRPAATVILARATSGEPELLMGQRGAGAVFMPSKYVFPGGAVDAEDHHAAPASGLLSDHCMSRLTQSCPADAPGPDVLVTAALRELQEETGLAFRLASHATPPLRFVFRAITPPGRTRRFDARFFLVDANALATDPDDFTAASGELSHLHWIGLSPARALDLPFITEVVLAEVDALLRGDDQPGVPFFDNSTNVPTFRRIV
ncbi:NUDIX hydrolase [Tabrizicola sp.]|uniref:NUDIX hydrolase n=1 Tax=Tabrizicola sp. TaxID=2005166 RepID=UPI00286D1CC5|nr:NUDIX hydrolase [Tabrizicola sp.]